MFAPQHKTSILSSVSVIALAAAFSFTTPDASLAKDFGSKFSSRSSSIAKRIRPVVRHRVRAPSRAVKARGARRTGGNRIRATSTSRFSINTGRVKSSIAKRLSGRTKTTSKLSSRLRVRNLKGRVATKPRRPRSRPSSAIAKKLAATPNPVSKRIKRIRTRNLKHVNANNLKAKSAKKPTRKEKESVRIEWSAVPVLVKKEIVATQRPATAEYKNSTIRQKLHMKTMAVTEYKNSILPKKLEMKTQAVAKLPTFAPQKKIDIKTEAFSPGTLSGADTVKSRTSTLKDTGFVQTGLGSALPETDVANVNTVPEVHGGLSKDLISNLQDIKDSRIANVPKVLAIPGLQNGGEFSLLPSGEHNRPGRLENLLNGFGLPAGTDGTIKDHSAASLVEAGLGIVGGLPTPKQSSATDGSYVMSGEGDGAVIIDSHDDGSNTVIIKGDDTTQTIESNSDGIITGGEVRDTNSGDVDSDHNVIGEELHVVDANSPGVKHIIFVRHNDSTNTRVQTRLIVKNQLIIYEDTQKFNNRGNKPMPCDGGGPGCDLATDFGTQLDQDKLRAIINREQTGQPAPHEDTVVELDEQAERIRSRTSGFRDFRVNQDCFAADCNDDGTGISTTHGSAGGGSGVTALQMRAWGIQKPDL